jgi:hypothetical protein
MFALVSTTQTAHHSIRNPDRNATFGHLKANYLKLNRTWKCKCAGAILAACFAFRLLLEAAPIHEAARAGNLTKVLALIQASTNVVNDRLDDGSTPLHEAVRKGHKQIVEALLQAGADPAAENKTGFTPLKLARSLKQTEIQRLLENPPHPKDNRSLPLTTEQRNGFELLTSEVAASLPAEGQRRIAAGGGKLFLIANVSISQEACGSHPITGAEAEAIAGAVSLSPQGLKGRAVAVLAPGDFAFQADGGSSIQGQYIKLAGEKVWNEMTDYHIPYAGDSVVADCDGRNRKLTLAVAPGAFPLKVSIAFQISLPGSESSTDHQISYRGRKTTVTLPGRSASRETAPALDPRSQNRTPGPGRTGWPAYRYALPGGANELVLSCGGQHSYSVGIRSTQGGGRNVVVSPGRPAKVSVPDGTYELYYITYGVLDAVYLVNQRVTLSGGQKCTLEFDPPGGGSIGATRVSP